MRFINPYNFIPLAAEKPSIAEKSEGDYTGYIEYDLYTKTPLFIPNTSNSDTFDVPGKVKDHKSFEFFSYDDLSGRGLKMDSEGPEAPVIPGSEIRGMFRSNYEILTNSCLSIVDDDKDVVLAKRTNEVFKPGLIRKDGTNAYSLYEAKDCLLRTYGKNILTDNYSFQADSDWRNKSYVQDSIPEGSKVVFDFVDRGRNIKPLAQDVKKCGAPGLAAERDTGYLIKGEPGPEMGKKQEKHCGHIFVDTKVSVKGELDLHVLERSLAEYEKSSQRYNEYAREFKKFKNSAAVGEYFPVYYSKAANASYIYLSPASMTREIYQKKMSVLLGKYAPCKDKSELCPACSLFGTVGKDKNGKMFNSASRIRFTDLHLKDDSKAEYRNIVTMKELSSPKLSNTEFYLKRPAPDAWFWTYDYYVDDQGAVHLWDAEINGRKFYWHRMSADLPEDTVPTERNTTVRPLKEGRLFTGKLYFEHVTKNELDQLIYLVNTGDVVNTEDENAVKTKSHGYKLGAGKPYGLGSIATSVRAIAIRSISSDGQKIELKNIPYEDYDGKTVDIASGIKANFSKLTAFDTVTDGNALQYPTTGKPGNDGEIHIFDWYSQNHVGYRKKNGAYQENGMPNSRSQMAFDQYMVPMRLELGETSYGDKVKIREGRVPRAIAERRKASRQFDHPVNAAAKKTGKTEQFNDVGRIKFYDKNRDFGYIKISGLSSDVKFNLAAFKGVKSVQLVPGGKVKVEYHSHGEKYYADQCELVNS